MPQARPDYLFATMTDDETALARVIAKTWSRATVRALAIAAETQANQADKLDFFYGLPELGEEAKRLMAAARVLMQVNVVRDFLDTPSGPQTA